MHNRWLPLAGSFLLLTLIGCPSNTTPPQSTSCGQNTAIIGVRDGQLSRLCGCDEASPSTVPAGRTLSCTVPVNSWIVFDFTGNQLSHQIASSGSPSFSASAVSSPSSESARSHAVQLTTIGTYTFYDTFEPTLGGQITTR